MIVLAGAAEAQVRTPAPTPPQWRGTIGVSGGVQTIGRTEAQHFVVQKNLEDAPIAASLDLARAAVYDVGLTVMLVQGRLGASVSVSSASRRFGGDVTAQIPHPFFFNTPRPVSGSVARLLNTEAAVHLDATYELRTSARFDLLGFIGPSIFRVTQDLVSDITYTDSYPYDTATFTSAPTTRMSATTLGFNLGADLTWKASRRVGVGALVRYAHGSARLTPSAGNNVSTTVGGLQVGGGLRFALGQ